MTNSTRTWRRLAVWLHVLTSVGWMTLALVLFALLVLAVRGDPGTAAAAVAMAHHLDTVLLAPLANASAATGLLLGLGTPWGLLHHRWVLTKLVITLVQLYAGIFLLSGALTELAAAGGRAAPPFALVVGTVLMAGAIAVQAWLSIAKPGGRTRWATDRRTGRPVRLPVAAPWVFAAAVLAPVVDIAVGTALGFPAPLLSLVTVGIAATVRRAGRRRRPGTAAAPVPRPAPSR